MMCIAAFITTCKSTVSTQENIDIWRVKID